MKFTKKSIVLLTVGALAAAFTNAATTGQSYENPWAQQVPQHQKKQYRTQKGFSTWGNCTVNLTNSSVHTNMDSTGEENTYEIGRHVCDFVSCAHSTIIVNPDSSADFSCKNNLIGYTFDRSEIDFNATGQCTFKGEGAIVSGETGKIELLMNMNGSSFVGQLIAANKGVLEASITGAQCSGAGNMTDLPTHEGFQSLMKQFDLPNKYHGSIHLSVDDQASWTFVPLALFQTKAIPDERIQKISAAEHVTVENGGTLIFPERTPKEKTYAYDYTLMVNDLDGEDGVFFIPVDASKNEGNCAVTEIHNDFAGHEQVRFKIDNFTTPSKVIGTVFAKEVKADNQGDFYSTGVEHGKLLDRKIDFGKLDKTDPLVTAHGDPGPFEKFWVITGMDETPTPTAKTLVGSRLAAYAAWNGMATNDTLMERLGDLRLGTVKPDSLWLRTRHARVKADSEYKVKMNTHHYELGYDHAFNRDASRVYWGGSFNWDEARADLTAGRDRVRGLGLALYRAQIFENGWYLDTIGRIGRETNKIHGTDAHGTAYSARVKNHGWTVSLETGRRIDLNERTFLQPEGQVVFGRLSAKAYTTSNGVHVDPSSTDTLVTRLGVKLGRLTGNEKNGEVYVKADLLREWRGENKVTLTADDERFHAVDKSRGTWVRLGAGVNHRFNESVAGYAVVDYDFKNHWGRGLALNAGLRWSF